MDSTSATDARKLVERYANPLDMDDAQDLAVTAGICRLLRDGRMGDECIPRLIGGLVLHLSDRRPSFCSRACIAAAALFRRDDFDIRSKECYGSLAEHLPAELTVPRAPPARRSVYEENEAVPNRMRVERSRHAPLFIQQAVRVLCDRSDTGAMRRVHADMQGILLRTSERSLHNHCGALYRLLLDLGTPELHDEQAQSLALLLSMDAGLYDSTLALFFESRLETLRVYIIRVFDALHGLVPADRRVAMHVKFAEAYIDYSGTFEPLVQREVEAFVTKGMMLVGGGPGGP